MVYHNREKKMYFILPQDCIVYYLKHYLQLIDTLTDLKKPLRILYHRTLLEVSEVNLPMRTSKRWIFKLPNSHKEWINTKNKTIYVRGVLTASHDFEGYILFAFPTCSTAVYNILGSKAEFDVMRRLLIHSYDKNIDENSGNIISFGNEKLRQKKKS